MGDGQEMQSGIPKEIFNLLALEKNTRFFPYKLKFGDDFIKFTRSLETHFDAMGLWKMVKDGDTPVIEGFATGALQARCRKDILNGLDRDVHDKVAHLKDPHDIFRKLTKLFIGTENAQKRKLMNELYKLEFERSYYEFLDKFENIIHNLEYLGQKINYKEMTTMMLNKIPPKDFIHPIKLDLEGKESIDTEEFNKILETITDFLIDANLYKIPTKSDKRDKQKKKKRQTFTASPRCTKCNMIHRPQEDCPKCYNCGTPGHLARNCTKEKTKRISAMAERKHCDEKRFLLDSGSFYHITGERTWLQNIKNCDVEIQTAGGDRKAKEKGELDLKINPTTILQLKNVYYWKDAPNLISVKQMTKKGFKITFENDNATITHADADFIYKVKEKEGMIYLPQKHMSMIACPYDLWHNRMNHGGAEIMRLIQDNNIVRGVGKLKRIKGDICDGCALGKFSRTPVPRQTSLREHKAGEKLCADTIGPYPLSLDSKKGALIVTDAGSNYTWCFPIRGKHEVPKILIHLITRLKKIVPNTILTFQSDNGTEFENTKLREFLRNEGIKHQMSIPYIHEENGKVERMNRTLLEAARTNLYTAGLPRRYWSFALKHAAHVQNRLPVLRKKCTPYQSFYGKIPTVKHIRMFGAKGYAQINREKRKKWDATAEKITLLGFAEKHRGYLVRNDRTGRIFVSSSMRVREEPTSLRHGNQRKMPAQIFEEEENDPDLNENDAYLFPEDTVNVPPELLNDEENVEIETTQHQQPVHRDYNLRSHVTPTSSYMESGLPNLREANMIKPKDPRSYAEAMRSSEAKQWEEAYQSEVNNLEQVGEIVVTERTDEMRNIIPFAEVFKVKFDPFLGKMKYKVRLAARGDMINEINDSNYSPVASLESIMCFLQNAVQNDQVVRQIDISGAYLYGRLEKPVILYLPDGHEKKTRDNKFVYSCPASLYGLRESGRVWYFTITKFLIHNGFEQMKMFRGLLKLKKDEETLFLLLYVDDILIGSTSENLIKVAEDMLAKRFKLKMSDLSSKYVGLEMERDENGITISQDGLIEKMILKYEIRETKRITTPLIQNFRINDESSQLTDVKKFQSIIGELLYLSTRTRPDIAFAVMFLSRHTKAPTKELFRCAKRIVNYLQNYQEFAIRLSKTNGLIQHKMEIYTDASFGVLRDEKFRSVCGYIVKLDDNVIFWKSKKIKKVAASATEAEYRALHMAMKKGIEIARGIKESFDLDVFPFTIYTDSQGSVDMTKQEAPSELSKFLITEFYQVKDQIDEGNLLVKKISGKDQQADALTKFVGPILLKNFRNEIMFERKIDDLQKKGSVEVECTDN